jgi:hypothetical protein
MQAAVPSSTVPPQTYKGSVALPLCATAQPLYTRFTKVIGASISEATMRPSPTQTLPTLSLHASKLGLQLLSEKGVRLS